MTKLEKSLYAILLHKKSDFTSKQFVSELKDIKQLVIDKHQSLYVSEITSLLNKIHLFGFHFSTLDIRQDSRAHDKVFNSMVSALVECGSAIFPKNYYDLSEKEQVQILSKVEGQVDVSLIKDKDTLKALNTMKAMKSIQDTNGEPAANRYIISNNQTTAPAMSILWSGISAAPR